MLLRESEAPERLMKRSLTALDLTALGIGAIIGTGIFALTGTAAAGEVISGSFWKTPVLNYIQAAFTHSDVVMGRAGAGPAVMISFIVAAVACGFAALCYAELAAMIPVSGSAYTYSYATLGEIVAWIIGWDLILEYAVGNMAVAVGWSGYFVKLCGSLFGLKFPLWAITDTATATEVVQKGGDALQDFSSTALPSIFGHPFALNIPAFLIVAAVTVLLIYGIRESARDQHDHRHRQSRGRCFLHFLRCIHGQSDPLGAVHAEWFWWSDEWRRHRLLCFHRIRCGLNDRGRNSESATRYADRHDRQSGDLHAALRFNVRRFDRHFEIHGLSR